MPEFNAPDDVTVDGFFKDFVPGFFEEALKEADLSMMEGKDFTLQFDVDGEKYCVKIKDGKDLEVIEGGIPDAMLTIAVGEAFWRESVTGKAPGAMEQFTDPGQVADLNRYNTLLATKGRLDLALKKDDGSEADVAIIFNGQEDPKVKLKLSMSDWADMQTKKADGPTLFMQGRMQFEGDMMFLMGLQSLM